MTALGHCRLSIVDLSREGEQPLHDDEGHIHAVVIGEIYDNEKLSEQCAREFGYTFRGRSDSELVVALYKHYGAPAFLDHLRGEYSFVLYDDRTGEVIVARDRFGVKPLFWTVVDGRLLVAAEIKAFLALGWKPEWDLDSIVLNSCYVGENTIFKNVYRVCFPSRAGVDFRRGLLILTYCIASTGTLPHCFCGWCHQDARVLGSEVPGQGRAFPPLL